MGALKWGHLGAVLPRLLVGETFLSCMTCLKLTKVDHN